MEDLTILLNMIISSEFKNEERCRVLTAPPGSLVSYFFSETRGDKEATKQ